MTTDSTKTRTRRAVLGAGLGAIGAFAAEAISRPADTRAATGGNAILGQTNTADQMTIFQGPPGAPALLGQNGAQGTGVGGQSNYGTGVLGQSVGTGPTSDFTVASNRTGVVGTVGNLGAMAINTDEVGVYGYANESAHSVGIWGDAHLGAGVKGTGVVGVRGVSGTPQGATVTNTGVYGFSDIDQTSTGVWGDTVTGAGVAGTGGIGVFASGGIVGLLADVGPAATGVYGHVGVGLAPAPPAGVAVQATADSTSQIALNVVGRARFNRSGRTSITSGHATKAIALAGVTTASYVIATLQTNRPGIYVQAVVPASGKFTIYLNKAVTGTTYVGYLVIN